MISTATDLRPSVEAHAAEGKSLHVSFAGGSKADELKEEISTLENTPSLVVTGLENSLHRYD